VDKCYLPVDLSTPARGGGQLYLGRPSSGCLRTRCTGQWAAQPLPESHSGYDVGACVKLMADDDILLLELRIELNMKCTSSFIRGLNKENIYIDQEMSSQVVTIT
jgi:hypothetical protein